MVRFTSFTLLQRELTHLEAGQLAGFAGCWCYEQACSPTCMFVSPLCINMYTYFCSCVISRSLLTFATNSFTMGIMGKMG